MTSDLFDLYATTRCPHCFRCESCGSDAGPLAPWAVRVAAGVLCLTLCPTCTGSITRGTAPPITDATAEKLADQHALHLRISRYDMGLVLEEEDRLADELAATLVAAALPPVDPDSVALPATDGHDLGRVSPLFRERVECTVCGSTSVGVDTKLDGRRRYAVHPMIPGEPGSTNCPNTGHHVGSRYGRPGGRAGAR